MVQEEQERTNVQSQSGGKFADHELMKLASKVVDGVSRPPSTPFEKMLVLYDNMKGVKNERKLTAKEQRIFDRVDAVVQQEFDAMFRRAEPMLKSIEKRPGSQSGGQKTTAQPPAAVSEPVTATNSEPAALETKQEKTEATTNTTTATDAAAVETKQEKTEANPAAVETKQEKTEANPAAAETTASSDPAAAKSISTEKKPTTPNTLLAAAAATGIAATGTATAAAATAAAPAKTQESAAADEGGGTLFMNSNRFIAVVWQGLKGIWEWIKSFFVGTMDDKMKEFMKIFNPAYLMSMIGTTAKDIENVDAKVKGSIEKLQTTVVSGISGAASASIDMVLNAFSMMPAFGTVLLVWRMFQNLLVIMGATLSVQAGKNELTGAVFNASSNQGTAAAKAKEVSEANPTTNTIKNDSQIVQNGGRRHVSSSMTKKINLETHRFKKSLKRHLHLRVPRFMPGIGGGIGGGSAFKSGYAAL